jgi:hypothetical protein
VQRSRSSGDAALNVVKILECGGNRADVARGSENISRILNQIRELVLGKRTVTQELPQEGNKNGVGCIAEIVSATASKHGKSSRLRIVFCDDEGQLYRIDPQSGEYAPIPSAPKSA